MLVKIGFITLDNSKKVYPDATISIAEAAAASVKATGYTPLAEARGGYPSGYFSVAKNNGHLKGLPQSPNTVLTKGMAARLTDNMLKSDTMVKDTYGSEGGFVESKRNLLNGLFNVYHIDGIVEGVDISRLAGENDIETLYAEIGGKNIYVFGYANIYDYLGYRVNAYYKSEKGEVDTLIYIETDDKNKETVIDIDDIAQASPGYIKAYENNRQKNYSFKKSIPMLVNGVASKKQFTDEVIDGRRGKVRLVDNTGDGSADIICVDAYETIVVSQVDAVNKAVYSKYSPTEAPKVLDLDSDDPYTLIYDGEGKESKVEAIKRGDVIAVFESSDDAYQGYVRVYIVKNTVTGAITSTKENGKKIIIDGKEYKILPECLARYKNDLKPGQSVTLKLDLGGYVADVEHSSEGAYTYGFISAVDTGRGLDGSLKIRLFADGSDKDFMNKAISSSVKIDDRIYKSDNKTQILERLNKAAKAMFGNTVPDDCYASVIRFTVNGNDEISVIDTVLNGQTGLRATYEDIGTATDSLIVKIGSGELEWRSTMRIFGSEIAVSKDARFMAYPSPVKLKSDGSNYDMGDIDYYKSGQALSSLVNERKYVPMGFYKDSDTYIADFVGCVYTDSINKTVDYRVNLSVVSSEEVGEMFNSEDGNTYDYITVNGSVDLMAEKDFVFKLKSGTPSAEFPAEMTLDVLKSGDVIKYTLNDKGMLNDVQLLFRPSSRTTVDTYDTSSAGYHWGTVRHGFVYKKFDGGMLVYFKNDPNTLNVADLKNIGAGDCDIVITSAGSPVYYGEIKGRKGETNYGPIPVDRLKAYTDTGEDCSRIMIQQYYGELDAVVEYK